MMERNWDVVREILLVVDKSEAWGEKLWDGHKLWGSVCEKHGVTREELVWYLEILIEGNVVKGAYVLDGDRGPSLFVDRLMWDGQELLASIKDEQRWEDVKGLLGQMGDIGSLEVLKTAAVEVGKKSVRDGLDSLWGDLRGFRRVSFLRRVRVERKKVILGIEGRDRKTEWCVVECDSEEGADCVYQVIDEHLDVSDVGDRKDW